MQVTRCADEAALVALGRKFCRHLEPGLQIDLVGDLGAGKTTFVRALLQGLGYTGPVRSPTYTLIEPYRILCQSYYHLDLYRLSDPEELEYLGIRDLLTATAILLIEWPEKGHPLLPLGDLKIEILHAHYGRLVECVARSDAGNKVLTTMDAFESTA